MVLDQHERHELHRALADGLGRETAGRLMAALPPVDWPDIATKQDLHDLEQRLDRRFDSIDHRFELIDQRFAMIDERLGTFEPMLEGKIATQVRGLFFALAGLYLANTALMAGIVGVAAAMSN